MNVKALKAFEATVEAGEFPADLSKRTLGMTGEYGGLPVVGTMYRSFGGSLDAAKVLHDAVLPGWVVANIGQDCAENPTSWTVWLTSPNYLEDFASATASNALMARAWLLAIIRALILEVESKE